MYSYKIANQKLGRGWVEIYFDNADPWHFSIDSFENYFPIMLYGKGKEFENCLRIARDELLERGLINE